VYRDGLHTDLATFCAPIESDYRPSESVDTRAQKEREKKDRAKERERERERKGNKETRV